MSRPHGRLRLLACSVTAGLSLCPSPALATFPGTNGKLVYTDTTPAHDFIAVASLDGTTAPLTSPATGDDQGPSWSPDGSRIAFSSTRDTGTTAEIYVMNADGTNIVRLTTNANPDDRPAFSPDASKIAYTSTVGGNQDIWVMNADGTDQTRLTTNATADYGEQWSPDGTKLVFSSDRAGGGIYTMNADGTGQTGIYTGHANYAAPTWSSDGLRIACQCGDAPSPDIVSFTADGNDIQNVETAPSNQRGPTWSPDGTEIAYVDDSANQIFVVAATGGTGTPLVTDTASRGGLQWQTIPDLAVVTGAPTDVTPSTAAIAGTVTPATLSPTASYRFEYGTTTAYGSSTPAQTLPGGTSAQAVGASLTLLAPFTTYHYRLVATNGAASAAGADMTFTTAGVAPAATTGTAVPAPTTAMVNGTVDSMGGETSYRFQYGPSAAYTASTAAADAGATAGANTVNGQLTGLLPGSTVHYRISATNAAGTTTGADATLSTPKAKPTLSLRARPTRDRTRPFAFRTSGRLGHAADVSASRACSGSVTLRVTRRRGGRTVGVGRRTTVAVYTNCTYRRTLRPRLRGRGRLRVTAKFLGNPVLKTASRSLTVRYG